MGRGEGKESEVTDIDRLEIDALKAALRGHTHLAAAFRALAALPDYDSSDAAHSAWVEEKRAEAVQRRIERLLAEESP